MNCQNWMRVRFRADGPLKERAGKEVTVVMFLENTIWWSDRADLKPVDFVATQIFEDVFEPAGGAT